MQYLSQKAHFSRCKKYRYSLERRWHGGSGKVLFIGLNPSTADNKKDDPTIRRCTGFAKSWGFGAMEIVNLFAFRATFPADLKREAEPIGPANDRWLRRAFNNADLKIACWGSDGSYLDRSCQVRRRYGDLYCLKLNRSLQPAHPLYLRADLVPISLIPDAAVTKGLRQLTRGHYSDTGR